MERESVVSSIYFKSEGSLFYIDGSDSAVNDFVRENREKIKKYLKGYGTECNSVQIIGITPFGLNSLESLILRQEPTLTPAGLERRVRRYKEQRKYGQFIYVTYNTLNDDWEAVDVLYKESIPNANGTFAKEIYKYLKKVVRNERNRSDSTTTRIYIPSRKREYIYRMPEGTTLAPEEQETPWDDSLYVETELLAQNILPERDTTISPIKIDEKYDITLPLYPQIEIKLGPLPKALYILLLRHPEGIVLKEISNYADEMRRIYCRVSGRQNPSVINRLMTAVTNPAENPLHKNLSLIRHSFLSKLNFEIARNYIPTHGRYKAQHIPLEESLVEIPQFA